VCCYFSWPIALSSHQRCGHGQELQRSQSSNLWRGSQQIFLVTRQVHCYNFTSSPAVTAPCSLNCGHSKKTAWMVFTEHFDLLSSVGEDVLDADTIASAEKFTCQLYKTSENSFDLACVVLLDNISSPERLPPTSDAFKQHLGRLPNCGVGPGAHSETGASEPRGDRLDASRRSTGPSLYDTKSNPEGLSGDGFIPMHHRLRDSSL